jgi:dienelactone hydrolase
MARGGHLVVAGPSLEDKAVSEGRDVVVPAQAEDLGGMDVPVRGFDIPKGVVAVAEEIHGHGHVLRTSRRLSERLFYILG